MSKLATAAIALGGAATITGVASRFPKEPNDAPGLNRGNVGALGFAAAGVPAWVAAFGGSPTLALGLGGAAVGGLVGAALLQGDV